jgi:hypothetical protein
MQHFSVHAASALLERSERTIRRALRHVKPDSLEHGQARYRLAKIIGAIESNADRPADRSGANDEALTLLDGLQNLFAQYDAGIAKLLAEPNIERRRALSLREKIGSVIPKIEKQMKAYCVAIGEEHGMERMMLDGLFRCCMSGFLEAIDMVPSHADLARWEVENAAPKLTSRRTKGR